jgi:hypothetical protein
MIKSGVEKAYTQALQASSSSEQAKTTSMIAMRKVEEQQAVTATLLSQTISKDTVSQLLNIQDQKSAQLQLDLRSENTRSKAQFNDVTMTI